MPIYEYRCGTCRQTVEVLILGGDGDPKCPNCGAPLFEKRMSVSHRRMGAGRSAAGLTCCGREERCEKPPCDGGGGCHRGRR